MTTITIDYVLQKLAQERRAITFNPNKGAGDNEDLFNEQQKKITALKQQRAKEARSIGVDTEGKIITRNKPLAPTTMHSDSPEYLAWKKSINEPMDPKAPRVTGTIMRTDSPEFIAFRKRIDAKYKK